MLYIILMCISCFIFFANDFCLLFYCICILDCGKMLNKKPIWAIFLFEFKMGHKAVETTCNINNTSHPGTASKGTVQWWFKKFCKGDESLEDEEHTGQPTKLTTTNWEDHQSWSSYNCMRNYPRTQCRPSYGHLAFEVNWRGEKTQ